MHLYGYWCFLVRVGVLSILSYATSVIGAANLFIHFSISPYSDQDKQVGRWLLLQLVTSIITLGAIIGALFGGYFSDRWGRKPAILLLDLFYFLGAFLLASANSVGVLVIGRIITGLGAGMAGNVVHVYLSETSPTPLRGRILGVQQVVIVLGGVASYLAGYFLNKSWRVMFVIGVVPSII